MSKEGKTLKESYQWQAKSQHKTIIEDELEVTYKIYRARNIGDIDNFNKILQDSLTGIVWKDDKQIKKLHIELFTDKKDPRVEIEIKNL